MSKAVIYARYSSEAQSDSFSIPAQLEICRDYIKKQGWELVDEYIDEAISGTSDKRSSFQRMIVDASNQEFDRVVVYAYDRFSRNRYDQVTYKHELRQYGAYVVSVTQPIDHNNPDSVLLESIYEGMAESYSRKLARESVRGSVQAAKQGFWTGGFTPYGYKIKKVDHNGSLKSRLEIDELEKPLVQRIYEMYLTGELGFIEIAKRLNNEGLKPRQSVQKAKSADKWTSSSIRGILTNQRYTGAMVWGKRKNKKKRGFVHDIPDIVVEDCHQAIITKEEYQGVQRIMESRRTLKENLNQHDYLLSGLVQCKCGQKMVGHSAKSGKYFYYVCNRKVKQGASGCDSPMVNKDALESIVKDLMHGRVYTAKNIESVARALFESIKKLLKQKRAQIKQIDYDIPALQRKYNKLVDRIAEEDDLDISSIAPRIKELKREIDTLNAKKESLQVQQKKYEYAPDFKTKVIKGYVDIIKAFLDSEDYMSNGTIKKFIDRIEIDYPNYIIHWKLPSPEVLDRAGKKAGKTVNRTLAEDKRVLDADGLVVRPKRYQELFDLFNGLVFHTEGLLKAA